MSNDYFRFRQFTVRQGLCAMKVGTDGTLLGAWASVPDMRRGDSHPGSAGVPARPGADAPLILDIGTGTGVIALMMAQRFPSAHVVAVDIDASAVVQARENVAASPFSDRVQVWEGDIRTLFDNKQETINNKRETINNKRETINNKRWVFDAIVCNPPFFDQSLESPDARRTLARHTASLSYRELMACCWRLLADGGELSVVIPFDCKGRMDGEAALAGFFKTRECAVRTTLRKPPRRHLLAFRKHPAPMELSELLIGSEEHSALLKDFSLQPSSLCSPISPIGPSSSSSPIGSSGPIRPINSTIIHNQ